MVVDSLLVPQCIYRPGTFTGLMTLYESNYIKLHQLASAHPVAGRCHRLVFAARQRSCTPRSSAASRTRRPCGSRIGSTTRGVVGAGPGHHRAHLPRCAARRSRQQRRGASPREAPRAGQEQQRELDRRWRLNMLLNKWLDYLFEVGHSLGAARARPALSARGGPILALSHGLAAAARLYFAPCFVLQNPGPLMLSAILRAARVGAGRGAAEALLEPRRTSNESSRHSGASDSSSWTSSRSRKARSCELKSSSKGSSDC